MAIFNEAYLTELFGLGNKKNKKKYTDKEIKNSYKEFEITKEDYNKAVAFAKQAINKLPYIKNLMGSKINDAFADYDDLKKKNKDSVYIIKGEELEYFSFCIEDYLTSTNEKKIEDMASDLNDAYDKLTEIWDKDINSNIEAFSILAEWFTLQFKIRVKK